MSEVPRAAVAFVGGAAVALAAVLVWRAGEVVLVVFAGLLVGVLLQTVAAWLGKLTGARGWLAVLLAVAAILVAMVGAAWPFAPQVGGQISALADTLPAAARHLRTSLQQSGPGRLLLHMLKDAGVMSLGEQVVPAALSAGHAAADAVVACFIGLFVAGNPGLYRRGLLALTPPRWRRSVRAALDAAGYRLRRWLMAQAVLMIVLGGASALAFWCVGMPIPIALGLLTGVLVFVPYLGALAAFGVTVLIAFTVDPRLALEVSAIFVGLHVLEAYVLEPFLQWDVALVPPALALTTQLLMFLLFGLAGVLLATPMMAAAMAIVQVVYVDGVLRESPGT
jgi:predicted PurR-regulated permease PerM